MKDCYSDDSYLYPSRYKRKEVAAMPFETAEDVPFWEKIENGRTLAVERKEQQE